jgi:hypothetical protein
MTERKIVIVTLLTLFCSVSFAQQLQDIFDQKKTDIKWLGLDFSSAKLIGDRERLGSTSDVQHMITAWNDLMITQKEKFDIAAAIDKLKVEDAVEVTKEHNASIDVTEIFSNDVKDHFRLKPDDIIAIVADYDFKGKSGIGVMFIVESFSKLNEEGAIWVTFINLDNKDVFFSERLTQKPGGFGVRNFWAGAIYGVMKNMQKKEFEMWRKKYYRK